MAGYNSCFFEGGRGGEKILYLSFFKKFCSWLFSFLFKKGSVLI